MGQFSCPGGTLFSSQHETCDWKGKVVMMMMMMALMMMMVMMALMMIAMTMLKVMMIKYRDFLQVSCNKP